MRFALVALLVVGCGDNKLLPDGGGSADAHVFDDAGIDAPNPNMPATLFDTGLCVDHACTQISADVHEYTPQFPLWADTATKRRWIYLPPGTQIDTTDMDHWDFPVGTKLWKEFTRDGVRIETRIVMRIGAGTTPQDWFYAAYQWNLSATDTTLAPPQTGVQNANGTMHDIPSRAACKACHENFTPTRVIGFGAIQLDWAGVNADDITLATLVADHTLTTNPPAPTSGVYYPIEGTPAIKAGMGYIHANCSHCHNPNSQVHSNVPMELRLLVGEVHDHTLTAAYRTAVGQRATEPVGLLPAQYHCPDLDNTPNAAECIIAPGVPADSAMIHRFEADPGMSIHMPALGSEMIDPTGDTTLTTWITSPN
ncbi:MAG: hypothetical protein ABI704_10895 [Kofleriaceae bacterium]